MAEQYSDVDKVMDGIGRLIDGFSFRLKGRDESIGKDMVTTAAQGIADMCANQIDWDGARFPSNEEKYAAYKTRVYGVHEPAYGFRTGQTFSLESLMGEYQISTNEVTMKYGTDWIPTRASAGNIQDSDRKATDREKLGWLMETGNIDVYRIGDVVILDVMEVVREGWREYLRDRGWR